MLSFWILASHWTYQVLSFPGEDGHKSEYNLQWLEKFSYENHLKRNLRNYVLWTKKDLGEISFAHVDYGELLNTENGVVKLMKSLVDYGVGFVEKVTHS